MTDPRPADLIRPPESDILAPHLTAGALAAVAGLLDAYVFLRVYPVFTANQSGNLILTGIAAGQGDLRGVSAYVLSLLCYLLGAGLGLLLLRAVPTRGPRRLAPVYVAELFAFGVLLVMLAAGLDRAPWLGPVPYLLLVPSALAMGLQGVSIRRAGGVALLTTASTGGLTDFGQALGALLLPGLGEAARLVLATLVFVIAGYTIGAAIAAVVLKTTGLGWQVLLLPGAMLLAIGGAQILGHHRARSERPLT